MNALLASAARTHDDAEKAVADASRSLQAPVEAKVNEIGDFRAQVKAQTKQLQALTEACQAEAKTLRETANMTRDRPAVVQAKIEVLHRRTRVLEEVLKR